VMQGGPGFQSDGSVRDIIQASGDVRGFENSKFLRIFLQVCSAVSADPYTVKWEARAELTEIHVEPSRCALPRAC